MPKLRDLILRGPLARIRRASSILLRLLELMYLVGRRCSSALARDAARQSFTMSSLHRPRVFPLPLSLPSPSPSDRGAYRCSTLSSRRLDVYQAALEFVVVADEIVEALPPGHGAAVRR